MEEINIKSFNKKNIIVFPWNMNSNMFGVIFRDKEIKIKNYERKKKLESL